MKISENMAYLAERIRSIVGDDPAITEKYMFGGTTFLLNGRILAGCRPDGTILLSVGKHFAEQALARPGASQLSQNGRVMTGFIGVEPDAFEGDEELYDWTEDDFRYREAQLAAEGAGWRCMLPHHDQG